MPEQDTLPAGFKPVVEDSLPAGFKPVIDDVSVTPKPPTSAAPAAPTTPSLTDKARATYSAIESMPIVGLPARALHQAIGGAKEGAEAVSQLPGAVWHAATDPATSPDDPATGIAKISGPLGLAFHRLIGKPSVDNLNAAIDYIRSNKLDKESVVQAVNALPMSGPMAAPIIKKTMDGDFEGALREIAKLATMGAITEGVIKAPGAIKAAVNDSKAPLAEAARLAGEKVSSVADDLHTPPQTYLTRALNPSDINFQKHIDAGLSELKAGEKVTGKVTNVETAEKALDHRTTVNNSAIDAIVKPQENIVVPGSGRDIERAQIDAIPDDVRNNPTKLAAMIEHIRSYHPHDYTIGELNRLRSELGATQSSFYGKDLSGQITMDAGTRAIDIARGSATRRLFYRALDVNGMGGGEAAAQINSRIGSIIHMKDALMENRNASVAAQNPLLTRASRSVQTRLGRPLKGVNENLVEAVKRWDKAPDPVNVTITPRGSTSGQQIDLFPIDNAPRPLLQPPVRTSSGIGESGFKAQQEAGQAARNNPPATTAGSQPPLGMTGRVGIEGTPMFPDKNTFQGTADMTPEEEYLMQKHQREIWNNGAPAKPAGQLSLERGMAPRTMGLDQTSGMLEKWNDPTKVPAGSTLAFKSSGLFGQEQWHYETPEGDIVTTDHEMSPSLLKEPTIKPKEPGGHWSNVPPHASSGAELKENASKAGRINTYSNTANYQYPGESAEAYLQRVGKVKAKPTPPPKR